MAPSTSRANNTHSAETLTVRAALELPSLRSGAPEVVAGAEGLDRPIRWVHVAEARNIANVVRGGELLISEGRILQGSHSDNRRLLAALAEREITALVIELGEIFHSIPKHVIRECQERGLTLIALHRPVPFIEVTEALHTYIVNHQITLQNSAEQLQIRLTNLVLDGAGVTRVVEAIAEAIRNPVVLEREIGGFAYSAYRRGGEPEFSAGWEALARGLENAPDAIRVPLVIEGAPAGQLVALALEQPFIEADRVALKRVAGIVALTAMRDSIYESPTETHRGFLTSFLHGEIAPYIAEQRAAATGFTAAVLMPIVVRRARHHRARPTAVEDRLWKQLWHNVTAALRNRHAAAIIDERSSAEATLVILGLDDIGNRSRIAQRFSDIVADAARRVLDNEDGAVICVGAAVHTWHAALEGLEVCLDAVEGALHSPPRAWHEAEDLDLDRLLWSLRDNPDLERFARMRLEKLVDHDRQRGSQLVKTLQVLLDQNGQKAETARVLHLERQSLYNRVERIESLLGVDLAHPDVRLGLNLAFRVMRHLPRGDFDIFPTEDRLPTA